MVQSAAPVADRLAVTSVLTLEVMGVRAANRALLTWFAECCLFMQINVTDVKTLANGLLRNYLHLFANPLK